MSIRYIFKQLLMPPGGLLLLLLLGWYLRRRAPRLSALCLLLGFGGLWAMSLPVTVERGAQWLERHEQALAEADWPALAQQAEVIVVLGAGRAPGDPAWGGLAQPAPMAIERMRYAARLARASKLPLLTSGGTPYGQPLSEAQMMADALARDFATPVRWQEPASRTTWENALFTAKLLREQGISRVVLVTQAWHMPRARWSFEQQGLQVIGAPCGFLGVPNGRPTGGWLPEGVAVWQSVQLINEAVGLLAYPLAYGGQ